MSRTAFGNSRSVYSFDGDWGNDDSWGANSPYDYFQRFDRERRTLSEDLRLVSRASVDSGADFAWLAGVYALRTDEDVQQTRCLARPACSATANAALTSDYRATNLAGYGELEWRLADADGAGRRARASSSAAPTTRIRMARPFRPTKPCSADR